MRFSRVVNPSSVGLAGYARTGLRQSANKKNFMRRSRALSCRSIVVGYLADAKLRLVRINCNAGNKLIVANEFQSLNGYG